MTMSEPATPTTPRKRRRWPRWAAALALLLLAAGGVGAWWAFYEPPLTEEEQRFVGCWNHPPPEKPMSPADRRANPIIGLADEYRADRTFHSHCLDTRTGVRFVELQGRWHAKDGVLSCKYQRTYRVRELVQGDLRQSPQTYVYRVVWENPDRFVTNRIDIPPGVWWPTTIHLRCPAPEYP
jgi:hypothetical protein